MGRLLIAQSLEREDSCLNGRRSARALPDERTGRVQQNCGAGAGSTATKAASARASLSQKGIWATATTHRNRLFASKAESSDHRHRQAPAPGVCPCGHVVNSGWTLASLDFASLTLLALGCVKSETGVGVGSPTQLIPGWFFFFTWEEKVGFSLAMLDGARRAQHLGG